MTLVVIKVFSIVLCVTNQYDIGSNWDEPERAPHSQNGVPHDLAIYVCMYVCMYLCIYVCIVHHSVNQCPHILIHWTASILQCVINSVNATTFK